MANIEVIFEYKGSRNTIQCKSDETLKNICLRFANKNISNIDDLIFLCYGTQLNLDKNLGETLSKEDKIRNAMNVIVLDSHKNNLGNNNVNDNNAMIKSKHIICPICKELCLMCIKNYKIILYGCKEDHKINNMFLDAFYNTQLINESEIKCNNCDKNKNNSYQKKFYKCIECDQNLCILCNEKHNKKHNIIDYDKKNYISAIHNDYLYSYCKECKMNLCMSCH